MTGPPSRPKIAWVVSWTLPKPSCPSLGWSADQSFCPHLITTEHEYQCWWIEYYFPVFCFYDSVKIVWNRVEIPWPQHCVFFGNLARLFSFVLFPLGVCVCKTIWNVPKLITKMSNLHYRFRPRIWAVEVLEKSTKLSIRILFYDQFHGFKTRPISDFCVCGWCTYCTKLTLWTFCFEVSENSFTKSWTPQSPIHSAVAPEE